MFNRDRYCLLFDQSIQTTMIEHKVIDQWNQTNSYMIDHNLYCRGEGRKHVKRSWTQSNKRSWTQNNTFDGITICLIRLSKEVIRHQHKCQTCTTIKVPKQKSENRNKGDNKIEIHRRSFTCCYSHICLCLLHPSRLSST